MALVLAANYSNSFEAGLAKAQLQAHDIMSFIFDLDMSSYVYGGMIPIRLMVDDEDLAEACRILRDA